MPPPPITSGVSATDASWGGVDCVVCEVPSPTSTILYFHGGGYRLGAARFSAAFGSRLARAANARVVVADYRLAPEHPFPAAIHDAAAAYGALLEAHGPDIIVGGDSAGGGLAAALVVACRTAGIAPPRALVLLSPWVDLTVQNSTFSSRSGSDQLFSKESALEAAEMYLQGHDPNDVLASPLFAELSGFPPVLVFAGGYEVLLEDTTMFASRLALGGVSVEAHVVAGMQHVWPTIFPDLDESRVALHQMGEFVKGLGSPG